MIPCLCVFGPTASGKSSLALRLAREICGTIISADSMQIYRGMDIGTAKPTCEEQNEVPHKMIDILEPSQTFSVYEYQMAAEREIHNAWDRSSPPIVVGGTGLYVDALLFHTDFGEMVVDPVISASLVRRADEGESKQLLEELKLVDPESSSMLHEKDVKRIVRALSVYRATGKPLSWFKDRSHRDKGDIDYLSFYLCFHDRKALYDRIEKRVDQMLENGLIEEARRLYDSGVLLERTASQAIGYKELIPFLRGEKSLDVCISLLKQKTRNYAKRQITWFKRYDFAIPLFMDGEDDPYRILKERSAAFLKRYES